MDRRAGGAEEMDAPAGSRSATSRAYRAGNVDFLARSLETTRAGQYAA